MFIDQKYAMPEEGQGPGEQIEVATMLSVPPGPTVNDSTVAVTPANSGTGAAEIDTVPVADLFVPSSVAVSESSASPGIEPAVNVVVELVDVLRDPRVLFSLQE
jgi:deoxyribose-phosphate aldolase